MMLIARNIVSFDLPRKMEINIVRPRILPASKISICSHSYCAHSKKQANAIEGKLWPLFYKNIVPHCAFQWFLSSFAAMEHCKKTVGCIASLQRRAKIWHDCPQSSHARNIFTSISHCLWIKQAKAHAPAYKLQGWTRRCHPA